MVLHPFHTSALYLTVGALVGLRLLSAYARGDMAWARHWTLALVAAGVGAEASCWSAARASGPGFVALALGAAGAWGAAWLAAGLLALWRNNLLIGRHLDRRWLALLAVAGATGAALYAALQAEGAAGAGAAYAYAAAPVIAGALYRLVLVWRFVGLVAVEQEELGRRIDRSLRGIAAVAEERLSQLDAGGLVFDPFHVRARLRGTSSA